ncbi:hypothetical protein [Calidifontibacter indicus]
MEHRDGRDVAAHLLVDEPVSELGMPTSNPTVRRTSAVSRT